MGMCFSLTVTALMIGMLGNIVRFPMEWAPFSREYFAGSNAVGPYFLSRYVLVVPYMYAPFVMATMVYWMTGTTPPPSLPSGVTQPQVTRLADRGGDMHGWLLLLVLQVWSSRRCSTCGSGASSCPP